MAKEMVVKQKWEVFRESGMLWFVNRMLHLFGWALVFDIEDGTVKAVYPAKVKFRGFNGECEDKGFMAITKYLKANIDEILEDLD